MTPQKLLTLQQAADELGVHYMTAYRYVRTGQLPASKKGSTWQVAPDEVAAFAQRRSSQPPRPGSARPDYPDRLEDRLICGDEAGAWSVIDSALGSSLSAEQVYTDVLAPAMASIGDRWARHELQIEQEHMASAIVQRLIGRLGPSFARRGRRRGTVVLGAPAGDDHGIPLLMIGDLLRSRGFDVIDLGANTPPAALSRAVAGADRLVAVGLCATRPDNDAAIAEAVAAVAHTTDAPVVLGGYGVSHFTEEVLGDQIGASVWTTHSTDEALDRFERLCRGGTNPPGDGVAAAETAPITPTD